MTEFYCPFCGSAVSEGENFCNSCGANVRNQQENLGNQALTTQQQNAHPPISDKIDVIDQSMYGDRKANTANILGILSLIAAGIGLFMLIFNPYIALPFQLVGLITGIIGAKIAPKDKTMSIIGIILSSIGLLISLIFIVLILLLVSFANLFW